MRDSLEDVHVLTLNSPGVCFSFLFFSAWELADMPDGYHNSFIFIMHSKVGRNAQTSLLYELYISRDHLYFYTGLIANILDRRPLTRSLYTADLVRESKVELERREDKTLEGVLRGQVIRVLGNGGHISIIQCHKVAVALNPRGVHGLGKDGGATADYTDEIIKDGTRSI